MAQAKARRLSAVIPKRYRGVSFDRSPVTLIEPTVVGEVRRYVADLARKLASGRGLWLLRELAFDIGYTLTTGGKWVWLHCALNAGTAVSRAAHGCDLGSSSTTPSRR